jgi:hypothetical protein
VYTSLNDLANMHRRPPPDPFANVFDHMSEWDGKNTFSLSDPELLKRYKQLRLSATLIEQEFAGHPHFVSVELVGAVGAEKLHSQPLHPQSWLITCLHQAPKGEELPNGQVPTVCENLPVHVRVLTDARVVFELHDELWARTSKVKIKDPQSSANILVTDDRQLHFSQHILTTCVAMEGHTAHVDCTVRYVPTERPIYARVTRPRATPLPPDATRIIVHFCRTV